MSKLCVFAGTLEGRRLIQALSGRGLSLTASVATGYGESLIDPRPDLTLHAGRMDQNQMQEFLEANRFDAVVDATHPYADKVSENLSAACRKAGTDYLRLLRPSTAGVQDGIYFPDSASCAEYLKSTQGTVLLTTGSKELPAFCADEGLRARLYARVLPLESSLAACGQCGLKPERILAMQGPFDEEMNFAMLRFTQARYLVTKDTGDAGGYAAKIRAAGRAGAQAVIIGRPAQASGHSLEEILSILEARFQLPPVKKRVELVGIGLGDTGSMTLDGRRAILEADALIGAQRMLDAVDCAGKPTYPAILARDIARMIRESPLSRFAVLFSGDVGFYSGARGLLPLLEGLETRLIPGVGSLQGLCARLGRGWEQVRPISLHGRNWDLVSEVRRNPSVFALLGGENGAREALERLCGAQLGHLPVTVGERLGDPQERILRGAAQELKDQEFHPLSVMLVDNPNWKEEIITYGLPDEAFDRGEAPMTKSEVRAVSLSKLALTPEAVVYDVGAGSGSVAVECARMLPGGQVYAIEKKPEAAALTQRNAQKFGLDNLRVVEGAAPEALTALPAPTHAFIGGSSGNMREIIKVLLDKNPGVRLVVNAVTLETLSELTEIAREFALSDIVEISAAKPRKLGRYQLMTGQNPVYIFTLQNPDPAKSR